MSARIIMMAASALALAASGRDLALRNVYSDRMLFQRDQPVVFAGTAEAGERVEVKMNGASAAAEADTGGVWRVELAPMKAGGPYEAEIRGAKRTLRLRDVLVGELWLASGQSNMAMPVTGGKWFSLTNGNEVAAAADDPLIRFAGVSRGGDSDCAHADVSGKLGWSRGDDTNAVKGCSATAWFFARELRRRLGIPVGVVVSAWSGSCIEPWIAEDAMKRHGLARLLRQLDEARHPPAWCAEEKSFRAHRIGDLDQWVKDVENTPGSHSREAKAGWMRSDLDEGRWTVGTPSIERPSIVWMRWHVDLPAGAEGVVFEANTASDTDEAWFDGRPIGQTDASTNFYWNLKRSYPVGTVASGRHVLAVRVNNHSGNGGVIAPRLVWTNGKVDLSKLAPRVRTEAMPDETTGPRPCCPWEGAAPGLKPRNSSFLPGGMYNAMIAPLDVFRFRGTIWYQGCANADAYLGYHACQKALVDGFRRTFGRDDMAFVCVQLAGYVRHSPEKPLGAAELSSLQPSETGFVMIRDEQARIRELPGCDCATAFDIGDPSDIHPKNKREVGRRLAGLAATLCYGSAERARGPEVVKAERKGSAVEIAFDEPVVLRSGAAAERTFALDDGCGILRWASARQVAPDRIRVESAAAKDPTRVDYGRAPYIAEAAVFNRDGYPLQPFRRTLFPFGNICH